jgi:hypothetical protein
MVKKQAFAEGGTKLARHKSASTFVDVHSIEARQLVRTNPLAAAAPINFFRASGQRRLPRGAGVTNLGESLYDEV